MEEVLQVQRLSERAILPTRGSPFAAGLDLYSATGGTIPPLERLLVPTDLLIVIPYGFYGRVAPRSGLALKHHLTVGAGVIDCDYRGPVQVLLFNHSATETFVFHPGDRIAQLIVEKILFPKVIEIDSDKAASLSTDRGHGGFGSSGTK